MYFWYILIITFTSRNFYIIVLLLVSKKLFSYVITRWRYLSLYLSYNSSFIISFIVLYVNSVEEYAMQYDKWCLHTEYISMPMTVLCYRWISTSRIQWYIKLKKANCSNKIFFEYFSLFLYYWNSKYSIIDSFFI